MPIVTEAAPPRNRRPWMVGVVLLPHLLVVPVVLLFSPGGLRLGPQHLKATVAKLPTSHTGVPVWRLTQGYRHYRFPIQGIPFATTPRPIWVEQHCFGSGPYLVALVWVDESNATRATPVSP